MTTASLFKEFIKNIRIQNSDVISDNYNRDTENQVCVLPAN